MTGSMEQAMQVTGRGVTRVSEPVALVAEHAPHCQGRSGARSGLRVHPCTRRATARVAGTHHLSADLCAQHARAASDRPGLVRAWLLQEEKEREGAGRPALLPAPRAGGPTAGGSRAATVVRLGASPGSIRLLRETLSRSLARCGWGRDAHDDVLMAVGEAVINAVEHGSSSWGQVEMAVSISARRAVVRVRDEGRLGSAFPLRPPRGMPVRRLRGRGRMIMLALADRVEVWSDGHGTSVELVFTRDPAAGL